jgi:hypothetical protein
MFKPGPFKMNLALLSLAVCLFLGAYAVPHVCAESCPTGAFSVPGEVNTPAGWNPTIAQPDGLDPTENCLGVGSYQYSATGGTSPYKWSLPAGTTGAQIDPSTGVLSVDGSACGSITVNVTDKNGRRGTTETCVTQNSKWILYNYEECCHINDYLPVFHCTTGGYKYTACMNYPYDDTEQHRKDCPCGGSGGLGCPCPGGCPVEGCGTCIVGKIYTYKRVCND